MDNPRKFCRATSDACKGVGRLDKNFAQIWAFTKAMPLPDEGDLASPTVDAYIELLSQAAAVCLRTIGDKSRKDHHRYAVDLLGQIQRLAAAAANGHIKGCL